MASREELLQSIRSDMKLTKDFFLRIYGYEITWPGFAEIALQRLEILGCSKARSYYGCVVAEYERKQEESIRPVAAEYRAQLERKWKQEEKKGGRETRKQNIMQDLRQKSDKELLSLLQRLN